MKHARYLGLALALIPLLAFAQDDVVVTQANKQFSVGSLVVRSGQSVTFVNDDRVRHNIALQTPSGEDKTGIVQVPGESTKLAFDQTGTFQVHCLIHPMMRMSVDVQ